MRNRGLAIFVSVLFLLSTRIFAQSSQVSDAPPPPLAITTQLFAASLEVGQVPPPLTFTHLQQAPAGAVASWRALKGKVVVLEFWATWCGSCVAAIPHMNKLAAELEGKPIQFIAVDDEDPAVANKFLAKMQLTLSGWQGFDTTKAMIQAYGLTSWPRTVIVDAQGRIAAITHPDRLTKEVLLDLINGKTITLPAIDDSALKAAYEKAAKDAAENAAKAGGKTVVAPAVVSWDAPPLFSLIIRPGSIKTNLSTEMRTNLMPNGKAWSLDVNEANVLQLYFMLRLAPALRLHAPKELQQKNFSMHLEAPSGKLEDLRAVIEQSLNLAASIKSRRVQKEEEVWTLVRTDRADALLKPVPEAHYSSCNYRLKDTEMTLVAAGADKVAEALENALQVSVLDETGLTGKYMLSVDMPASSDVAALSAALEKGLGLRLVKARRSVEYVELEAIP